jgi:hypothetical protein
MLQIANTGPECKPTGRSSFGRLSELFNRRPSDHAIDHFIAKAGADRVLAALDRLTAPAVAAE